MPGLVFKRSVREVERRAAEAPRAFRGKISGYARDPEEAFRVQRERGEDNPRYANHPLLADTLENPEAQTAKKAGIDPESIAPRKRRR